MPRTLGFMPVSMGTHTVMIDNTERNTAEVVRQHLLCWGINVERKLVEEHFTHTYHM